MHAKRELEELREKLAQVEAWKARHAEIERELAEVWEQSVSVPDYAVAEPVKAQDGDGDRKAKEEGVAVEENGPSSQGVAEEDEKVETEADETHDEADYQEAQEEMGNETETETTTTALEEVGLQ